MPRAIVASAALLMTTACDPALDDPACADGTCDEISECQLAQQAHRHMSVAYVDEPRAWWAVAETSTGPRYATRAEAAGWLSVSDGGVLDPKWDASAYGLIDYAGDEDWSRFDVDDTAELLTDSFEPTISWVTGNPSSGTFEVCAFFQSAGGSQRTFTADGCTAGEPQDAFSRTVYLSEQGAACCQTSGGDGHATNGGSIRLPGNGIGDDSGTVFVRVRQTGTSCQTYALQYQGA